MMRHTVIAPPARWTEDERPAPFLVVRTDDDDGEVWYRIAEVVESEDALDIATMLNELEDRRADNRR